MKTLDTVTMSNNTIKVGLKSPSKRLRHYDIFLCSFCNVCPIYKLSSQIYSLDYEDYFQLLATAQKRFLHFENEDEKITVLRRQYLCALKIQ